MDITIKPGMPRGSIIAPASKSMTQRALAAALLYRGKTIINGAGQSADEQAALQVIQDLGARVHQKAPGIIEVDSDGADAMDGHLPHAKDIIHCGESGLAARLFTPIAALCNKPVTITGEGSLLKRPMHFFEEILPQLGVTIIKSNNGHLPIELKGPLVPKYIEADGSVSSQFISGLLFAYYAAQYNPMDVIHVKDVKSRPYIDMTIDMLHRYGYDISTDDEYKNIYIGDQETNLVPLNGVVTIDIEGDWSSAAYMLVAGAIAGNVSVNNLNIDSKQADKALLGVLRQAGAEVTHSGNTITVKNARLDPFEFDATHCPDLFPVLAVLASLCRGESYIHGIHRLYHKESNRVASIGDMLHQFGVFFSIEDDSFCINGTDKLRYTVIDSYNDHRIAMAASIGALRAKGNVTIMDAGVVSKSYPSFFYDLGSLGIGCVAE